MSVAQVILPSTVGERTHCFMYNKERKCRIDWRKKLGIVRAEWVEKGALLLIKYLPLLFLPITVGIITFFDVFIGKGFLIIIIVLISTALVMISTGMISQFLLKEKVQKHE